MNITVADLNAQCKFNHSGTLCGGCQDGLSLTLDVFNAPISIWH